MIDLTFATTLGGTLALALPNYILWDTHDGFGHPNVNFYEEKTAYQNGSSYVGFSFQDRKLDMNFTIVENTVGAFTAKKQLVQKIFNPANGEGILTIVRDSTTYYAKVHSLGLSPLGGSNHGSFWQDYQLSFTGLDCSFYGASHSYSLVAFSGGFSFPFSFPFSLGTVGWTQVVANAGDMESPPTITIVGEVSHPRITNITTGKFIELYSVLAGETVVINCATGKITKTVGAVTTNAMHYMTMDSDFLTVLSGNNTITYTATSGIVGTTVTFQFYDRYSGI
jgi:hypothetical protein